LSAKLEKAECPLQGPNGNPYLSAIRGSSTNDAHCFMHVFLSQEFTGVRDASGSGTMMRRDWSFRRQALPMAGSLAYLVIMLFIVEVRTSPFAPGQFAPIHLLPHLLGLIRLFKILDYD
jgi:hypothetical protein